MRTESTPTGKFQEALNAMFWESHPYHWPVVGWPSDIPAITKAQADDFYGTFYAPQNITLVIPNDLDGSLQDEQRSLSLPADDSGKARVLLQDLLETFHEPNSTHPISGPTENAGIENVFLMPVPSPAPSTGAPSPAPQSGGTADEYATMRKVLDSLGEQRIVGRAIVEKSKPLLEAFEARIRGKLATLSRKSELAGAIQYSLNHWNAQTLFCEDGQAEISNALAENALRCVSLGRKNFLFAGSNEGGKRLALFYSLLASCKKQQVNPWEYMKNILERMPTTKTSQLRDLLPDRWKPNL